MILSLLPVVHRVARSVRRHLPSYAAVQTDDLVSAGVLGLIDALKKYDARRRTPVEHYAVFRIRGAMLDSLREWDCAPRPLRRISKAIERAAWKLEAELGRAAEGPELARALGMTLDRWHQTARELRDTGVHSRTPFAPVGTGKSETPRARFEVADRESPFEACARHERSTLVAQALGGLPERERQIITLYYRNDLTQKQIGVRLCLSEARVCQLRYAALHRLRKTLVREVHSPRYLL
ncbi:MAG: sigma-70 family RNA polymerase sigma factor [Acidobacteriia bacterium]|nr:sigma-70 family RNA polymerase sigma factor [Terriglobia bacterium]